MKIRMFCNMAWLIATLGCGNEPTEFSFREADPAENYPSSSLDGTAAQVMQEFAVDKLNLIEMNWAFSQESTVLELPVSKPPATTFQTQQADRTKTELSIQQGYDGETTDETFPVWETGKLDLLIVVDNSGTMANYQNMLAARLEPLLEHVSNTNWNIAVVTTDNACIRDMISRSEYASDPEATKARFAAAIEADIYGSTIERGIEMAVKGLSSQLKCDGQAIEWRRQDARTAVLALTDEENCGSVINEGCPAHGYEDYDPARFLAEAPADTRFYGLLHDENECGFSGYDYQPSQYYDLVNQTNGLWKPICQADYLGVLTEISQHVSDDIVRKFNLAVAPEVGTLEIFDGNQALVLDHSIANNEITIPDIPGALADITFRYRHGSKARFSTIAIASDADLGTLAITANLAVVPNTNYQITNDEIVFLQPIPDTYTVAVEYRQGAPLNPIFPFSNTCSRELTRITIDGVSSQNFQVEGDGITFSTAPSDGAIIALNCWSENTINTSYQLPAADLQSISKATVLDDEDNVIPYSIEGNEIVFAESLLMDINILTISIPTGLSANDLKIPLPGLRDGAQIYLELASSSSSCPEYISVQDELADLSCLGPDGGTIRLTYELQKDDFNKFPIREDLIDRDLSVALNGTTIDFTLEQGWLIIDPATLEDGDLISILAKPESSN
jgi:hypothetical protein